MRRYVAYYRVLTGRQQLSGLGIDAQREAVQKFARDNSGQLIAEFSETSSGRKNSRPQLNEAIRICRVFRAVLIIARLDRLARNVEMIASLMESGLEFVAADFPHANRFTIHILAAVAEYESKLNSERVKLVHAQAKQRGVKLGQYRSDAIRRFHPICRSASNRARKEKALSRARDLAPIIWKLKATGKTWSEIAAEMNSLGIATPKRGSWYSSAIKRIVKATASEFGSTPEANAAAPGSRILKMLQREREIGPMLALFKVRGMALTAMSAELHARGLKPPRGKRWSTSTLSRYITRPTIAAAPNLSPERLT